MEIAVKDGKVVGSLDLMEVDMDFAFLILPLINPTLTYDFNKEHKAQN